MLKRIIFYTLSLIAGAEARADANQRTFTLGTLLKAEQVMPYKQYSGSSSTLQRLLFPPILNVDRDGRIRCVLCKEIPTVEVRKGTNPSFIIAMELKKDLKWGDGKSITAKDVKFTLEQMAKANYPTGEHPLLPIRRIELDKAQPNKITLVLRHRRSDAFQLFAISLFPEHKSKDLQDIWLKPERSLELLNDPAYSYGTYRVAKATPESFQLVTNDKTEWETKPEQPLTVSFFKDQAALAQALKGSLIDQTDDLSWNDYLATKAAWPEFRQSYEPTATPSDTMQVVLLNLHSPILVNPQLRLALFYAINRQSLNALQYDGLATPANGLLPDAFAERIERTRQPPYNPEQAAQLLEQSGWTKGADGIRTSDGQRFEISFSCPKERLDPRWIDSLSKDLQKLGIKLDVEQPDNAEYKRKVVAERRFRDMACVSWNLPLLSIPNNLFHSLAIPTRENNYFGSNFSSWDAHVVDRLLDNMLREIELHHFVRQFGRLDKQFMSDLPGIPLLYEPQVRLNLKAQAVKPSEELSRILQTPTQIKL